jgi:hypothetical protein
VPSILCDPNNGITESFAGEASSTVYEAFENERQFLKRSSNDDVQNLIIFQAPDYIENNISSASLKLKISSHSNYCRQSNSLLPSVFIALQQDYSEISPIETTSQADSELTWINQYQSIEAEEVPIWKGVFTPHHAPKILFSKNIEIEVRSLPNWKPRVVIESYRLEDDDE